jgi:ribose/xylose/arabinose/galactoside ABC-type transport system permease subunit
VLLSVLAPLAIGLLCGLLNGLLIVALDLHPFIVTLGTMSIFRGVANVLPWDTLTNTLDPKTLVLPKATAALMKYQVAGVNIVPGIAMLICVVLGGIYLRLMVVGRENYAIGGNEEAARFSGLAVKRIKLRVYALSGLSAGIAGMVSLGRFGTASTSTGNTYELTVIAAAVVGGASLIGGRGTALGALLGTLVIAMIENGIYTLNLKQEYRLIIIGCAIVVAVSLDQISALIRQRRLARLGGRAA